MAFASISSIVIGAMIIVQWSVSLMTSNVPELSTAPASIGFHMAAEMMLALFLIIPGAMHLSGRKHARYLLLIAQGMLIYSVVNSSGYFVQNGQWIFLIMFLAVITIAVFNVFIIFRETRRKNEMQ